MKKIITILTFFIFVLLFTSQIFTQSVGLPVQNPAPLAPSTNCTAGIVYDDGTFENGYGWNCGYGYGRWVQKMTPPAYPYDIEHVCIALTTLGSNTWTFSLEFWDTTGAGGGPGVLKDSIIVTATGIGTWPSVTFASFDNLTGIPPLLGTGASGYSYYIGIGYDPCANANKFIGANESTGPVRPAYGYIQGGWTPVSNYFPNFKNFGIRAERVEGISENNKEIPKEFKLYTNYPNPFNPVTTIKFDLPEASVVKLAVFNILGEEVTTFANNDRYQAGIYSITVDMSNFPSGAYFYRIFAGSFTDTKKMLLVK